MAALSSSSLNQSDSEMVREFTAGAGQPTPDRPQVMSEEETKFIAKMILDETMELMATIYPPEKAKETLIGFIRNSEDLPAERYGEGEEFKQIADQADALVDIMYYSQNCACKKGVNLSSIFKLVHGANMAKRDPETGKFLKRADGKIIKPKGWTPPDVNQEILRQLDEGSFPSNENVQTQS